MVYGFIKLDVAKAYDRVSWTYLSHIMLRLGFDETCVRRIMQLVTSVKYSVRVNDDYTDYIVPQRGLRQGDPLSPYLFIICTEGVSALINHYKQCGLIDGIKICQRATVVSHLLFADDSLIFMKITDNSIRHVKALLSEYEYISGQSVNYHKSEAVLSRNAPEHLIAAFESVLGVKLVQKHCKYLRVPLLLNRKRSDTFQSLLDKLWSKIQGWKNRLLSVGGRHTLVTSVLNTIPLYWLSCFSLPDKCLNKALLAKQCWRIVNNEHLLVSRLLKAKYFHNCHLLESTVRQNASHVWQSLRSAIPVLRYGSLRQTGTSALIWKPTASGNLDIKSSYRVANLLTDSDSQQEEGSNQITLI
ncbi:unnamed protein product [Rhodiola kirilowii]